MDGGLTNRLSAVFSLRRIVSVTQFTHSLHFVVAFVLGYFDLLQLTRVLFLNLSSYSGFYLCYEELTFW